MWIQGNQREVFNLCLGNQEAVERITVMKHQAPDAGRMTRFKQILELAWQRQLVDGDLNRDFPKCCHAYEGLLPCRFDGLRDLSGQ